MNRRTSVIALIASALLAGTSSAAEARPLPDPLPRHLATTSRDAALAHFVAAYRTAPLSDKRRIHNEIVLILADPQFVAL
jgi:hypothetical protein